MSKTKSRAKWQVGQTVRTRRYLPPVPTGTVVAIAEVRYTGGGEYRYRLENGQVSNLWCYEGDVELPIEVEL